MCSAFQTFMHIYIYMPPTNSSEPCLVLPYKMLHFTLLLYFIGHLLAQSARLTPGFVFCYILLNVYHTSKFCVTCNFIILLYTYISKSFTLKNTSVNSTGTYILWETMGYHHWYNGNILPSNRRFFNPCCCLEIFSLIKESYDGFVKGKSGLTNHNHIFLMIYLFYGPQFCKLSVDVWLSNVFEKSIQLKSTAFPALILSATTLKKHDCD